MWHVMESRRSVISTIKLIRLLDQFFSEGFWAIVLKKDALEKRSHMDLDLLIHKLLFMTYFM